MKKTLLIILWLMSLASFAQGDYRPLVEDGKRWNYILTPLWSDDSYYSCLYLSGDTIINGHSCKKMYEIYNGTGPYLYAGIYEIEKKVYYYHSDGSGPIPLFDFSLEKGQTVYNRNYCYLVTDIDTILHRNQEFKRFHLQDVSSGDTFEWVEGIGINDDMFNPYRNLFGGIDVRLLSCELNGEVIFTGDGFDQPSISDVAFPQLISKDTHNYYYFDLQGRRIQGQPQRGVYIKDGRKVVMR